MLKSKLYNCYVFSFVPFINEGPCLGLYILGNLPNAEFAFKVLSCL